MFTRISATVTIASCTIERCIAVLISQLEDDGGDFAIGLLKELARAYLTATSSDNTRAQVY